jgi:hypothetical protein
VKTITDEVADDRLAAILQQIMSLLSVRTD